MEKEEHKSATNLLDFIANLKALIQNELGAAFDKETKVYTDFLNVYQRIFSKYAAAFGAYKQNKDTFLFLNETIAYYTELNTKITKSFDAKEPLTLAPAIQSISEKTLQLFAQGCYEESSYIFDLLKNTREERERQHSGLQRFENKIKKALRPKSNLEDKDSINSIIYAVYDESITTVLKTHETELLTFYKQFAELALNVWTEFQDNNAFINKLDNVEYVFESLDDETLAMKIELKATAKLEVVLNDFTSFKNKLASAIEDSLTQFDLSSLVHLKDKSLSTLKINKSKKKYFQSIVKQTAKWRNTRLVLMEDWLLDLEIFSLKYKIIQKYIDFKSTLNKRFTIPLNEKIDAFDLEFGMLNDELEKLKLPKSEKDFRKDLLDLKQQMKNDLLDKSVPVIRKQLNNPLLIAEIDAFESLAKESLAALSERRLLIKNPDYLAPINADEIDSISPSDLISFEIKPDFITVFSLLKRTLIEHTQSMLIRLETAPNIAIYSFESAIKLYEEKKEWDEAKKVCSESILRSREKVLGTKAINDTFILKQTDRLKEAINKLSESAVELTNNSSALQIKIRIVRAKALARTQEVKNKIIAKVLNLLPIVIKNVKQLFTSIEKFKIIIAKQFALDKTQSFITTDISHFLATAQLSISKLPYIYQRLFSFEPLDSFNLYVERKQPMDELEMAYSSWKQEKFAPVVLIGERGSGKTTFLRKFIHTSDLSEKIVLIDFLAESKTASENFKSILDVVQAKKKRTDEKKIVIIDGFERLFESKINGFDLILDFFKVISDTQKEIFWIVSVHSISWGYFDKCIQASNYFGYHIRLNNLSVEELVKLIESRHNLSGYNVVYNDLAKKKSLLSGKNYDTQDPQIELRKNFFNQLNKSVQGNILQAYIYWLRSAHLTEDNWISIKSDNQLNFDFVRGIPPQKLQILKNILIQNGLTVESLALSFRISKSKSELELKQLLDDGIVSVSNNVYYINSLIYKQLIKHLNDINLLH